MKFAALADVPIIAPPVGAVHHETELPVEIALRFEEIPRHKADGVAITEVGADKGIREIERLRQLVVLHVPSALKKYEVVAVIF